MLRIPSRPGVAALVLSGAMALASPAFAQTAQGQFTPDANAPIQLHMPVHLHAPASRRHLLRNSEPKPAPQAVSAPAAPQASEGAPIPFGSAIPPATAPAPAPHRAAAMAKPHPAKTLRTTVVSTPPASRAERRKAVQEVLSGSASAFPSSGTAADVSAPEAAIPFSFDAATVPDAAPKSKAPAARPAVQGNHSSGAPARPRTSVAALEPPPKVAAPETKPKADPHAGLVKRGEILFAASSTDPEADGAGQLKTIAGSLNTALESESARVEIEAFGGPPGDKSSDARRLSLRRALAIRQLLIDSGIPANRIDVKAQGGIDDQGKADRVDVYLSGAS
jgi:outer membrane protein OmpA-like peptidoglycan-associated protein